MVKEELNLSIIPNFVVTVKCEYNEKQLYCISGFEKLFHIYITSFLKLRMCILLLHLIAFINTYFLV